VSAPSIFGRAGIVPSSASFSFAAPIELRRQHQTRQAATGVRVQVRPLDADDTNHARPKIISAMHAVLKESKDRGLTTGAGREIRTKALGGDSEETGNAANAALAAAARDQRVCGSFSFLSKLTPRPRPKNLGENCTGMQESLKSQCLRQRVSPLWPHSFLSSGYLLVSIAARTRTSTRYILPKVGAICLALKNQVDHSVSFSFSDVFSGGW
jgi:hypothetical protein